MRHRLAIGLALLMASPLPTWTSAAERPVWFWHEDCSGRRMALEITLDGKRLLRQTFSVCRRLRDSREAGDDKIRVEFIAPRAVTWDGYRDENNTTPAGAKLETQIWQAGADPDAMILGVDVMASGGIYMNALHVARINRESRSEIGPGFVVRTFPLPTKA